MNLAGMAEHGRCKLNILHDPVFTMKRDILPGPFINFYCLSVHTRGIPCIILLNDALLSFYFYERKVLSFAFVVENIKPQIESKTFILIAGYTLELSNKGLKP